MYVSQLKTSGVILVFGGFQLAPIESTLAFLRLSCCGHFVDELASLEKRAVTVPHHHRHHHQQQQR